MVHHILRGRARQNVALDDAKLMHLDRLFKGGTLLDQLVVSIRYSSSAEILVVGVHKRVSSKQYRVVEAVAMRFGRMGT